jgi:DNA polymerase-3 subunit chi
MTRVDFYVLQSATPAARQLLACRLAEKAYSLAHQVYIHTDDDRQAAKLDTLLWTFRDGSFVPHQKLDIDSEVSTPVLIGHQEAPDNINQVLINLHPEVPMFFSRFERVVEIVNQDEMIRQQGRRRYQFYRERGYQLQTHKLDI